MAIINEIPKGPYAPYNGMLMFRIYNSDEGFKTRFKVNGTGNDQTLDWDNNITVPYVEYFKNDAGEIVHELTRFKYYVVPNREGWEKANNWFTELARGPVNLQYGIMDQIEYTLNVLPQDVPNGYILPKPE